MNKVLKNIALCIGGILLCIVFLSNIFYVSDIDIYERVTIKENTCINLLISVIVIGLISFLSKKIEKKCNAKIKIILLIIVLITFFVLQILWINIRSILPSWDQWYVCDTAVQFFQKSFENVYKPYFEKYPHQLGLSTFYTLIFKLFNTSNIVILQYINAFFNTFTLLGIFLISKNIEKNLKVNKTKTIIAFLLFATVPLLATFVYGDFIALSFCTFALYFIMLYSNKEKTRYAFFSIICMAFACLVRKNSLIFFIAILAYLLLYLFENPKIRTKTIIIMIILTIASVAPLKLTENYWQRKLKLDFENKLPTEIYLSYGISESAKAPGWYEQKIDVKAEELKSGAKIYGQKIIKRRLKIFLQNPLEFLKFYAEKERTMWTENTYAAFIYNDSQNIWNGTEQNTEMLEKVDKLLKKTEKAVIILNKTVIILAFGNSIITLIRYRNKLSKDVLLLVIAFTGGFLFQMMWEAKSRYIIPYIVILFPIIGIDNKPYVKEKINQLRTKI